MINLIAKLIDYDPKKFTHVEIRTEFNNKYGGSYLKIDNKYVYIIDLYRTELDKYNLLINYKDKEEMIETADTIEKVTPLTGLYSSKHGLLYLHKLPNKQYTPSLKIGHNYKILFLKKNLGKDKQTEFPDLHNTIFIPNPVYQSESVIYDNEVYLHWRKVGKLKNNILYIVDKFVEEIKEIWKQYPVISEQENHNIMDDKPKAPFLPELKLR